ncbi:MAG: acyltransferase domain-containing protein [Clostridiales bacterium]|nr:acyltransferase domain-containing protein [Clostridiales bacterium]MDD7309384.1 acyltransferase domain-containing protein [Eubacteriales bacterium]MDY5347218.1 acyltransferase domain-containing protein [Eubacteriales bacterium]
MKQTTRTAFALNLMEQLHCPVDSIAFSKLLENAYFLTGPYAEELDQMESAYMAQTIPAGDALKRLSEIAGETGVPNRAFFQLFYMNCAYDLHEMYRERGISEEIFLRSMDDMRCKLLECREVFGIWGNDTWDWPDGFFKLDRFALGRLQFEPRRFDRPDYHWNGITIRTEDPVLNMHIPSAGPFPRELRYDSYRRAYAFYPNIRCEGKYLPIKCSSWLLFPSHDEFLSKTSNIVDFLHDFDVFDAGTDDKPTASWRIFGRYHKEPFDKLPRNTALRRAYADWLASGHDSGWGRGLILFDGEKIVNNARGE